MTDLACTQLCTRIARYIRALNVKIRDLEAVLKLNIWRLAREVLNMLRKSASPKLGLPGTLFLYNPQHID